jgi:hypothetical protein
LGGVLAVAIEGMCRRGERDPAVAMIRVAKTSLGPMHARFAKAAADAQQYDTAFAALDAFESEESSGWTDLDNRTKGLTEIIKSGAAHHNWTVVQTAVGQLRMIERLVRAGRSLKGPSGVALANAYALAGEYDSALDVADDAIEAHGAAHLAIALALTSAGHGKPRRW